MTNYTRNFFAACLAAAMFVFFAASAVAQTPVQPGQVVVFLPNPQQSAGATQSSTTPPPAPAPQCCPDSVKPAQGSCCAAPLDDRLGRDVGELQRSETAVAPLRGTNSPVPPKQSWNISGYLTPLILLLVGLGIIGAILSRRRPAPLVPAPVVPPAPPVPAPAPVPAPPAPAPRGTPCPNCGVAKPNLVARFCAGCGHVLPALLFALLLFGFGHAAIAQQTATVVTAQQCGMVNGVLVMGAPGGQCFSLPASPVPHRTAVRPTSAPTPVQPQITAADISKAVSEGVSAAIKEALPAQVSTTRSAVSAPAAAWQRFGQSPASPAATPAAPSAVSQQMVNSLAAVEKRQNELAAAQNQLGERLDQAEADIKSIGAHANKVGELAVKTGNALIPKVNRSAACGIYDAIIEVGGKPKNPMKGCKQ